MRVSFVIGVLFAIFLGTAMAESIGPQQNDVISDSEQNGEGRLDEDETDLEKFDNDEGDNQEEEEEEVAAEEGEQDDNKSLKARRCKKYGLPIRGTICKEKCKYTHNKGKCPRGLRCCIDME